MNRLLLTSHVRDSFRRIGADVRAVPPPVVQRTVFGGVLFDQIRLRVRDETFELVLPAGTEALVRDCRAPERHLVLAIRELGSAPQHFLCGFDERHWFAASVTGTTVAAARESLLPPAVRAALMHAGLRHRDRFRRHTAVFLRQGEWFFVPTEVPAEPLLIRRQEPLVRPGGGKAHVVAELSRGGTGEMVWYHPTYGANGLNDAEYAALTDHVRKAPAWRRMTRVRDGGRVLARGTVRHPDHATLVLNGWHAVYLNNERRAAGLGFLD